MVLESKALYFVVCRLFRKEGGSIDDAEELDGLRC